MFLKGIHCYSSDPVCLVNVLLFPPADSKNTEGDMKPWCIASDLKLVWLKRVVLLYLYIIQYPSTAPLFLNRLWRAYIYKNLNEYKCQKAKPLSHSTIHATPLSEKNSTRPLKSTIFFEFLQVFLLCLSFSRFTLTVDDETWSVIRCDITMACLSPVSASVAFPCFPVRPDRNLST